MNNETSVCLDTSWYLSAPARRSLSLDRFNITLPFADERVLERMPHEPNPYIGRALSFFIPPVYRRYRRERKLFSYDPALLQQRSDIIVFDGYWQHPAYFERIAQFLRIELTPTTPFNADRLPFDPSTSISLHVRRTDYVTKGTYSLLPLAYYEEALYIIRRKFGDLAAVIFSDDPTWAREQLPLQHSMVIDSSARSDDFEQFTAMSMCAHHIIANSTFSWWAAWLNSNPEKHVIAPRHWFTHQRFDISPLLLPTWQIL